MIAEEGGRGRGPSRLPNGGPPASCCRALVRGARGRGWTARSLQQREAGHPCEAGCGGRRGIEVGVRSAAREYTNDFITIITLLTFLILGWCSVPHVGGKKKSLKFQLTLINEQALRPPCRSWCLVTSVSSLPVTTLSGIVPFPLVFVCSRNTSLLRGMAKFFFY